MLRFAVRRTVWAVPTLLLVTFLVYIALRLGTQYCSNSKVCGSTRVDVFGLQFLIQLN